MIHILALGGKKDSLLGVAINLGNVCWERISFARIHSDDAAYRGDQGHVESIPTRYRTMRRA